MKARLQLSGIALAAASCCATSAFALRVDQEAIAIETARSAGTVGVRQTEYEFLNSGTNAVLTGAYNQFGTPAPSDSSSVNVIFGWTDRGKWLCDTCSDLWHDPGNKSERRRPLGLVHQGDGQPDGANLAPE